MTRFADEIIMSAEHYPPRLKSPFLDGMARLLKNHTTKRILVDAPQWEAFFQADPLPKEVLSQLHWPFDNAIYLEPTHPIMPADMDIVDHALKESINAQGEDVDDGEKSYIRAMVILPTGERRTLCILNSWKGQMMSATCELNLQQGTAHGEPPPGFTPQQDQAPRAGAEALQVHTGHQKVQRRPARDCGGTKHRARPRRIECLCPLARRSPRNPRCRGFLQGQSLA